MKENLIINPEITDNSEEKLETTLRPQMLDEYIAALIYQIDPERALAVVYVNELKQALDKNLTTKLDLFKKASFLSLIMDDALKEISNYISIGGVSNVG